MIKVQVSFLLSDETNYSPDNKNEPSTVHFDVPH